MVGNETSELYDIYGIWHVPFWQTKPFIMTLWCLWLVCAVALIYLVCALILNEKDIKPWTWANRELDALWEKRGFTREDGKRFYSQLTEIIKVYLEKRYGYQVRSATDIELLAYLRDIVLIQNYVMIYHTFLKGRKKLNLRISMPFRKK